MSPFHTAQGFSYESPGSIKVLVVTARFFLPFDALPPLCHRRCGARGGGVDGDGFEGGRLLWSSGRMQRLERNRWVGDGVAVMC